MAGARVGAEVFGGGAGGQRRGEEQAELVGEGAARLLQVDHDPPARVVGFDPRDPAALGFGEPFGPDDVGVEGRAGRVDQEEAFDRVGEVGGPDRGAVGVAQPLAQEERVGPAAVGDLRQSAGQARDHLAARGPVGVGVGEQRHVGVVHRGEAFGREGQRGVECVGEGGVGDPQRAAFLAAAGRGGRAARAGDCQGQRRRQREQDACGLSFRAHVDNLGSRRARLESCLFPAAMGSL